MLSRTSCKLLFFGPEKKIACISVHVTQIESWVWAMLFFFSQIKKLGRNALCLWIILCIQVCWCWVCWYDFRGWVWERVVQVSKRIWIAYSTFKRAITYSMAALIFSFKSTYVCQGFLLNLVLHYCFLTRIVQTILLLCLKDIYVNKLCVMIG